MSQIFNADAKQLANNINTPDGVFTEALRTNPLTPPFGTCKAKVLGVAYVTPQATATFIDVQLWRNPDGENREIGETTMSFVAAPAAGIVCVVAAVDEIPDGRDVVYQMLVAAFNGAGPSQIDMGSYLEATLISG